MNPAWAAVGVNLVLGIFGCGMLWERVNRVLQEQQFLRAKLESLPCVIPHPVGGTVNCGATQVDAQ